MRIPPFPRCAPLLLLPILGAALAGCGDQPTADAPETPSPEVATEPMAELERLDLAGLRALIDEAAAQDRVLVIDFWATWCIPCVQIFPELHERLKALGEDVRPASVTIDEPADEAKAIAFLREHDAMEDAYMLMPDSDAQLAVAAGIGEDWSDLVVPAILVYNAEGELVGEYLDREATPDAILAGVEAALASGDQVNR